MNTEVWRNVIDLNVLAAWMDRQGLEGGPIVAAQELTGGTQNILLRFRRGTRDFVLRRPPLHLRNSSNETIRREARVLAALGSTNVPHPPLIAGCEDENVLGAAFYLMEPVAGFNPRGQLPMPHSTDPAMRRRMGFALIEGIATLACVDHLAVGLGEFGKPVGFLERQAARWGSQLDSYHEYQGWPGPAQLPNITSIADWLESRRPQSFVTGILHGDYHLSNVMFRPESPELAAIVDWELATIGDPLIDLGWLLATWPERGGAQTPGVVGTAPWDGFPTAAELIEHYGHVTTRDLKSIEWYAILGCYKLGIILEGTYARACAGKAAADTGTRLHAAAVALLARARTWIDEGISAAD